MTPPSANAPDNTDTLNRFLTAFAALPLGTHTGTAQGRRYVFTKSSLTKDAYRLVAEELGGSDYISLNLYHLASGARLRPCEMPEAKVIAFVLNLRPDP